MRRVLVAMLCVLILSLVTWRARRGLTSENKTTTWQEVEPNVLRSIGSPSGYALVDGDSAMLIGAARSLDWRALQSRGVTRIEGCLLTHHHRDTSALASELVKAGIKVRAAKASVEWLSKEGVARFWKACLPELTPGREPTLKERTFNAFTYLVHARGIDEIDCSLEEGQVIEWRSWTLRVIGTPGHSRDHISFAATRRQTTSRQVELNSPIIFCGDAIASRGKLWSPYTTDWDHWTHLGLKASAESLRKIANFKPLRLYPEHGSVMKEDLATALEETASALEEVGFLKSFERFSKQRLGNEPKYEFLAKDQVATAGEKPWTKLSPHLYLTGNTFVLRSESGSLLVLDPFGANLADQIRRLQSDEQLGPIEVVLISHAHNDHYVGLHQLPNRESFQVWTLDEIARPIAEPFGRTAFGLDARSIRTDRWLKNGETVVWRDFSFDVRHFPGQTYFTMGLLTTIDGRRGFFTADNFFHADQFSGSGGWSGRNRGWPDLYAKSAKAVLDAAPEWVLAEHGGAFEFNAEDFQRRVRWGQLAAKAADSISPSGSFRRDWHPSRIQVEPLVVKVRAGETAKARVVIENPLTEAESLRLQLDHGDVATAWSKEVVVPASSSARVDLTIAVSEKLASGRHVVPLIVTSNRDEDGADSFVVVEVIE